ncbi:MAG: hypothetical protein IJS08_01860 [Victivallales bacterium]|nr:hypothetical protein [Victivallales bacterium]
MIGRKQEKTRLKEAAASKYSEFVAVYGRRRVGKTFLVRETFNYTFTFQHSGLSNASYSLQLSEFWRSLKAQGLPDCPLPHTWFDAFDELGQLLSKSHSRKKIVFLDELPWMDTPRSNFVSALEHFWNGWASARKDILLIICGSATSWIISKVLKNHGGLHNRVTMRLPIRPFTLRECKEFAAAKGLCFTKRDVAECYMIMGGIPFYWSLLQRGQSLAQNIDALFFKADGELHHEYQELFSSLFKMDGHHVAILEALGKHNCGLTRKNIIAETKLSSSGSVTQTLEELEECGFIRRYSQPALPASQQLYQLSDNFTLFHYQFIANNRAGDAHFWTTSLNSPLHSAWSGLAFERLCFQHIAQIQMALGISGVSCNCYAWIYKGNDRKGAQVDLVIDRQDNIINLCEIKYTRKAFAIDRNYSEIMRNRLDTFIEEASPRKAVHLTLISASGLTKNNYSGMLQCVITLEDLFQ